MENTIHQYEWRLTSEIQYFKLDEPCVIDSVVFEPHGTNVLIRTELTTAEKDPTQVSNEWERKVRNILDFYALLRFRRPTMMPVQIELLNEKELEAEKAPRVSFSSIGGNAAALAPLSKRDLEQVPLILSKVQNHKESGNLLRAFRWFSDCINEPDRLNSYIQAWIAFNAMYGLYSSYTSPGNYRISEENRAVSMTNLVDVKALMGNIIGVLPSIVDVFGSADLRSYTRSGNLKEELSEKLKAACGNNDVRLAFEYLIKCLYQLRCNIFHGEAERNAADEVPLLDNGRIALQRIVSDAIQKFVDKL